MRRIMMGVAVVTALLAGPVRSEAAERYDHATVQHVDYGYGYGYGFRPSYERQEYRPDWREFRREEWHREEWRRQEWRRHEK